ncbi:THAS synthase, partial [Polyodon spathula]|nr:THAS synthase [Polyodon spathula]
MGQAFIFLLAGYETTSSTLAFAAYLLAIHQDCQEKLQREVDEFYARHVHIFTALLSQLSVQELQYLDMVISETLRMLACDAAKDWNVNGHFIPAGATVAIPAGYIYYDPEYWPEPEKFLPKRFTAKAKSQRHPFTYFPFGAGPWSCIAMRLALLEEKIAMIQAVQKFTFQ